MLTVESTSSPMPYNYPTVKRVGDFKHIEGSRYKDKVSGKEYIVKESSLDACAGAYYKLMVGNEWPTTILVEGKGIFYSATEYDSKRNFFDDETLAKICVASFLLADVSFRDKGEGKLLQLDHSTFDLKGLFDLPVLLPDPDMMEYFDSSGKHLLLLAMQDIAAIPDEQFADIADRFQLYGIDCKEKFMERIREFKRKVQEAFSRMERPSDQKMEQFYLRYQEFIKNIDPNFLAHCMRNPEAVMKEARERISQDPVSIVTVAEAKIVSRTEYQLERARLYQKNQLKADLGMEVESEEMVQRLENPAFFLALKQFAEMTNQPLHTLAAKSLQDLEKIVTMAPPHSATTTLIQEIRTLQEQKAQKFFELFLRFMGNRNPQLFSKLMEKFSKNSKSTIARCLQIIQGNYVSEVAVSLAHLRLDHFSSFAIQKKDLARDFSDVRMRVNLKNQLLAMY